MSTAEVTVIVVSYGGADLLRTCLQSIPRQVSSGEVEVIVVDNASPDGTPDMVAEEFPWVTLIRSRSNDGFAAGNNQGLQASEGRAILLLNPDAELVPGALETCLRYLRDHEDVPIVAPKILNPDGSLQYSLRNFPTASNTVFEAMLLHRALPQATPRWAETIIDAEFYRDERHIEWASGAAFVARAEAFDAVGPLDERFFLFSEETDWFFRASRQGLVSVYLPSMVVIHRSSAGRNPALMRYAVESRLLYARKNLAPFSAAIVRVVLGLGMAARLLAWAVLSLTGSAGAGTRSKAYRVGLVAVLGHRAGRG